MADSSKEIYNFTAINLGRVNRPLCKKTTTLCLCSLLYNLNDNSNALNEAVSCFALSFKMVAKCTFFFKVLTFPQ